METFDNTIRRVFALPFLERLQILDALRRQPDQVIVLESASVAANYVDFVSAIKGEHVDKAESAFWTANQTALKAALYENILDELIQREIPHYTSS